MLKLIRLINISKGHCDCSVKLGSKFKILFQLERKTQGSPLPQIWANSSNHSYCFPKEKKLLFKATQFLSSSNLQNENSQIKEICSAWHWQCTVNILKSQFRSGFSNFEPNDIYLTRCRSHRCSLNTVQIFPTWSIFYKYFQPDQCFKKAWYIEFWINSDFWSFCDPLVDCPTRWSLWYLCLDFHVNTQMTWEI